MTEKNVNPKVQFSRDGRQFDFNLLQLPEAVRQRKVLPTDYYWMAGQDGWRRADELIAKLDVLIAEYHRLSEIAKESPPASLIAVTTTPSVDGYRVVHYKGVVRGLMVRSPNILEGLGGAVDGILGGKQGSYMGMCEKTRREAYDAMVAAARDLEANAVIGVAYDTTEIMARCTEVLCYGTAVVLEPLVPPAV